MLRVRRFKFTAVFSLIVGLAVLVSAVSAGRWISTGDGSKALQLDRVCKDGFSVIGAFVRGSNIEYPSAPVDWEFYARLYREFIDIEEISAVDLVTNAPNYPTSPIVARSFVHIQEQPTSITVEDNFRGFGGETTWWGTASVPWSGPLDTVYPYISMFYGEYPNYAFGTVANPTGFGACYLFPPDAKDDRFSTRRNTQMALSAGMVLANDSDPNGNPFSIVSYTPPAHGRIIRTSPLMGYYIPNTGFVGIDTATYTIQDSTGATDTATLTFEVRR